LKLSLIFPLSQEKDGATEKLRDIASFWARFPIEVEVLLVLDPSRGETLQDWQNLITATGVQPRLQFRLEMNSKKLGRGASVQKGLDLATGEILAVNSFDLSIPLGDVFSALQEFIMHRDQDFVVIGNRRGPKKKRRGLSTSKRMLFENIEHDKAASLQVPDPTCPFLMLKKKTWLALQPLRLRRWFYSPGLVLAARHKQIEVRVVDVQCLDHPSTRLSLWDLFR